MERAVARIDLGALRANAEWLREVLGEARLCAVVKADGYGHGAVEVARAAIINAWLRPIPRAAPVISATRPSRRALGRSIFETMMI